MKKKYQNAFFIFGIAVLVLMVSQLDFRESWNQLQHAGYWFLAVLVLWLFLYIFNTLAWNVILKSTLRERRCMGAESTDGDSIREDTIKDQSDISFFWLYKVTISGFAINYATPVGLMGSEPYRIMMLSPKVGTECASSSVILYAMTHVFSHFWFWFLSVFLYLFTQPLSMPMGIMLAVILAVCSLAIWFFLKGYKKGVAVSSMRLLSHIPFVKKWAKGFIEEHAEQLSTIDRQIAALHNQNPKTFLAAVLLELSCRILSALEIYFILLVFMPEADYIACILILAFTSLFANMLFFIPLQLGGREGGFLMSARELSLTTNTGIAVALLVRIRELIWTAIGMILIKFNKE